MGHNRRMKKAFYILLSCVIFLGMNSCQQENTFDDEIIINDLFLNLVAELRFNIIEPFGPPAPPPIALSQDTFFGYYGSIPEFGKDECISYISHLRNYYESRTEYYYQNYLRKIEPIILVMDTILKEQLELQPYVMKQVPNDYKDFFENKSPSEFIDRPFYLEQITNSGIFKLVKASEYGFTSENYRDFDKTQFDFFISGGLSFSQVTINHAMRKGWFLCSVYSFEYRNERALFLVLIEEVENIWTINDIILFL